ncbi:MAG: GSU2403 family nucleotidyltransferase fold protein, partial [Pseudomonadota bacterium]
RALDVRGMLGKSLAVVGTFSMFSYEAAAGVHLQDDIIATEDVDLLWDVRRHLRLAGNDWQGLLGVLRNIDSTFERDAKTFRASSNSGFMVDLIRPLGRDEMFTDIGGIGGEDDLIAAAIQGLVWLVSAPKFESIAIDESGRPVRIACIDPRAFALHKAWLSSRSDNRDPKKRRRDLAQARAAASIAREYLSLGFEHRDLAALPAELRSMEFMI